ncbi:MAG: histidine kinase [Chitinophagaceae bacterium]
MSNLEYAVIILVAAFLLLAIGIILFVTLYQRRVINHQIEMREFNRQKQLELMQASIRSEEEERMRIASELHDDVGATLSSIRLFLTQAGRQADNTKLISQSKDLLDQSIQKIRDISHQLQPGTLQYLGLKKALQSFAETINRAGAIHIDFEITKDAWPEPDAQTSLSVYRIIQELVNNIIKHSGALQVHIAAIISKGHQCIEITHNGKGLMEDEYKELLFKKGALGLKNIENRLKSSNLTLIFPTIVDKKYCIQLRLPPISVNLPNENT